jgi:uncharacterized membrane protein
MGQLIVAVYKDIKEAGRTLATLQTRSQEGQRNLIENACLVQKNKEGDKSISQAQVEPSEKSSTKGSDWLQNLAGQIAFKNESIDLRSAGEKRSGESQPSQDPSKVEPAPGSFAEKKEREKEKGKRAAEYETDLIAVYGVNDQFVSRVRQATQGEFSAVFLYLDRVEDKDLYERLKQNEGQLYEASIIPGQGRARRAA